MVRGLSWTTNREVAKRYAEYAFKGISRGNSYIQSFDFRQQDIAFYDESRNECEIVTFKLGHTATGVEKLPYVKSIFEH